MRENFGKKRGEAKGRSWGRKPREETIWRIRRKGSLKANSQNFKGYAAAMESKTLGGKQLHFRERKC